MDGCHMSLVTTFRVGSLTCHALDAGRQRLDGGAMFGVVPKPLWERRIPADERNRIPLSLRCLLVEHDDGLVLVDSGVGNKESEKFIAIYAVENSGRDGPSQLEDAIVEAGFRASDIKYIINTHLHFDHAGGNTFVELAGAQPELSFPNAVYVVQERELEFALHTNERTAASYLPANFLPVTAAGRWRLVDGEAELIPGITLLPTPGHVPHHQSVLVSDGGQTACFVGDLIPTAAHISLPWIMGYDLHPLVTLETKRRFLERAEREDWILVLEHEPGLGLGRVVATDKGRRFEPLDTPKG